MNEEKARAVVSTRTIILDQQGKLLVLRRSKTAPHRVFHWDLPGGIVDAGEDVATSAMRETFEESGIRIQNPALLDITSGLDGGEFWISVCFVAQATNHDVAISYEHDEYKWVTPEEFLKLDSSPGMVKFMQTYVRSQN